MISDQIRNDIYNYLKHRIRPGRFLMACLCNNLEQAVDRADGANLDELPEIVSYMVDRLPSICWGSESRVILWLAQDDDDVP